MRVINFYSCLEYKIWCLVSWNEWLLKYSQVFPLIICLNFNILLSPVQDLFKINVGFHGDNPKGMGENSVIAINDEPGNKIGVY